MPPPSRRTSLFPNAGRGPLLRPPVRVSPCPSMHTRFVHIPGLSTWVCVLFALAHSIWCVMLVCFSSQQPILRRPRTESHRIMLSVAKSRLLWKKISAPQCSFTLFSHWVSDFAIHCLFCRLVIWNTVDLLMLCEFVPISLSRRLSVSLVGATPDFPLLQTAPLQMSYSILC